MRFYSAVIEKNSKKKMAVSLQQYRYLRYEPIMPRELDDEWRVIVVTIGDDTQLLLESIFGN